MAIDLRSFTPARVALGRTGHSLPTRELLRFQLDHARARDAVYEPLDPASLGMPHVLLHSAAPDRATYLRRPDLGRRLRDADAALDRRATYDAAIRDRRRPLRPRRPPPRGAAARRRPAEARRTGAWPRSRSCCKAAWRSATRSAQRLGARLVGRADRRAARA